MPAAYNNGSGYFLYVNDIAEVSNYSIPQGSTMFFMNKNEPVLYIKSVNMFNQQTVTIYDLIERKQIAPPIYTPNQENGTIPSQNDYVRKDELSAIVQDAVRNELRNNRSYKPRKED